MIVKSCQVFFFLINKDFLDLANWVTWFVIADYNNIWLRRMILLNCVCPKYVCSLAFMNDLT